MDISIDDILIENERRNAVMFAPFNPITGEGSILVRKKVCVSDFPLPEQWLPVDMLDVPLVKDLVHVGSVRGYLKSLGQACTDENVLLVVEAFVRIRFKYDFCFWAALLVYIKPKGGGEDVKFVLSHPQRKLIASYEEDRIAGIPIRLILLKARQWGGSTATQMYFAWLQCVHKVGLNSIIVAQVKSTAGKIIQMFAKMLNRYPVRYLLEMGEACSEKDEKWSGYGDTHGTHLIPQRNCTVTVGSAEKPDSVRGDDYNLVHCSEVGLWTKTDGKSPEDIVRSACSGVVDAPYTMIVYESTANGVGNFFHREYKAAKEGTSAFKCLFVAWYEIELYRKDLHTDEARRAFADRLLRGRKNRNVESDREESGEYLWWLWEKGATLEAIFWYIGERRKHHEHGTMASEFPSDDIEAFVNSGSQVFNKYNVDRLRSGCRGPQRVGEVVGDGPDGEAALSHVRFQEDTQGQLLVWSEPEIWKDERVTDRYLVVVDIGGRGNKADWSVITVIDRLNMIDGGKPEVVAQWRGHIDMGLLAWKAAQIAQWYDEALLVIESNTLETHDKDRQVDGDQSGYILNLIKSEYDNLYARSSSSSGERVTDGDNVVYGFHTNTFTKPRIISLLIDAVRESAWVERDSSCCDELDVYERKQNGSYGAIQGEHDDILMTRAIGLWVCFREMDLPQIVKRERLRLPRERAVSAATW